MDDKRRTEHAEEIAEEKTLQEIEHIIKVWDEEIHSLNMSLADVKYDLSSAKSFRATWWEAHQIKSNPKKKKRLVKKHGID